MSRTLQELQSQEPTKWDYLDKGAFNKVRLSATGFEINRTHDGLVEDSKSKQRWVFKKRTSNDPTDRALSDPNRVIRAATEIYPCLQSSIIKLDDGFIMPYLDDEPGDDFQMAAEVVDIYRRTRYIVLDAFCKKNILIDPKTKKPVLIDFDYALKPNREYTEDTELYKLGLETFEEFWCEYENTFPITISNLRALVHLEKFLTPRQISNRYLKPDVLDTIARYYYYEEIPMISVEILEKAVSSTSNEPSDSKSTSTDPGNACRLFSTKRSEENQALPQESTSQMHQGVNPK